MSRVIVLRHSEAAKARQGTRDIDRPLDEFGVGHAISAGEAIAAMGLSPKLVLCSPARRTRETWEGVAQSAGEVPIRILDALYGSDAAAYLAALRSAGQVETVLLIGHNPMIAETALLLVGEGDAQDISNLRSRFPTSSFAVFRFDVPLAEITPHTATLEAYVMRRD